MDREGLRLECVRLASAYNSSAADIVAEAKKLFDFVIGEATDRPVPTDWKIIGDGIVWSTGTDGNAAKPPDPREIVDWENLPIDPKVFPVVSQEEISAHLRPKREADRAETQRYFSDQIWRGRIRAAVEGQRPPLPQAGQNGAQAP